MSKSITHTPGKLGFRPPRFCFSLKFIRFFSRCFNFPLTPTYTLHTFDPNCGTSYSTFGLMDETICFNDKVPSLVYFPQHHAFYAMDFFKFFQLCPNFDLQISSVRYGNITISVGIVFPRSFSFPLFFTPEFKKYISTSVHFSTFSFPSCFDFYNPPLRYDYPRFVTQSDTEFSINEPPADSPSSSGFGLIDILVYLFKGVGFMVNLGSTLLEFPKFITKTSQYLSKLNSLPLSLARNPSALVSFISALLRLMHDLTSNFSISNIAFDFLQLLIPFWGHASTYVTQSLSFYQVLSSLVGIPSDIHSLLLKLYKCADAKNSPVVKAYDLIVKLFVKIITFVTKTFSSAFPSSPLSTALYSFLDNISFSTNIFEFETTLATFLTRFNKDQSLIHTPSFRQEAIALGTTLRQSDHFQQAILDPSYKYLRTMYGDLVSLLKNVEAFSNASRVVPAFIVLEGPPGSYKSTVLSKITDYYSTHDNSKSIYTHVWKTTMEGKDFYDDYNNQDIMVLDDVGQGGVGQWAKVMNFVSSIKLPLDCAEAEKKNTKFFTSEYIFCTTNLFSKIQSTTPNDGISDLHALFRRPLLFSFSDVNANDEESGEPIVTVTVKHFDYKNSKKWVDGLPSYLSEILTSKGFQPQVTETGTPSIVASWITAMAELLAHHNKTNLKHLNAGFTSSEVAKYFTTQSFLKPSKYTFTPSFSDPSQVHPFRSGHYSFSSLYSSPEVMKPAGTLSAGIFTPRVNDNSIYQPSFSVVKSLLDFLNFDSFSKISSFVSSSTRSFLNFCLSLFSHFQSLSLIICGVLKTGASVITSYLNDNPSLKLIFSSLLFLSSGALLYFIRNLLKPSSSTLSTDTLQPFAPPSPFETQGLIFDGSVDQSPSSHVYQMVAKGEDFSTSSLAVVSGRRALVSRHSIFRTKYLTLYRNSEEKSSDRRVLDDISFKVIYDVPSSELSVIEFNIASSNLFKKARSIFHPPLETGGSAVSGCFFATCDGVVEYNAHQISPNYDSFSVFCDIYGKDLIFSKGTGIFHPASDPGMCGAPLFSKSHGFLGIHVAGEAVKTSKLSGFVAVLGTKERLKISELMLDCGEGLELESIEGSGMRLRYPTGTITPRTPLKRSRLYDTGAPRLENIEEKVIPPMVDDKGRSLLEPIVAPILDCPGSIKPSVAEMIRDTLVLDYEPYGPLTWEQVVSGDESLSALNKDSVNGYGYDKDKTEYINFDKGELQPSFLKYIEDFEERLLLGKVEVHEMMAYHQLKDETRPLGKVPRTFAVMPLHLTVLFKKYFGALFKQVKDQRHTNGYAMGLNPYKEWPTVWTRLISSNKKLFDGDFKRYDRSLIAPILEAVMEAMCSRFRGTEREKAIQKELCVLVTRMFILVGHAVYLVTHGLQSGWWLTAFVNSAFNKGISIGTLYLNLPRKNGETEQKFCTRVKKQFARIVEYYLGDDRISGVPQDLAPYFNMFTMRNFVTSLGMDMTDGLKKPISQEHPFCEPENLSFLKRKFKLGTDINHPVTCPLSLETLGHLFAYVDETKDVHQVMEDRSVVFQIERYLHPTNPSLDEFEESVKRFYRENNYNWKMFPKSRIEEILSTDEGYNDMMALIGKYVDY